MLTRHRLSPPNISHSVSFPARAYLGSSRSQISFLLWRSWHISYLKVSFPGDANGKKKKKKNCQCRRCKRHGFDPASGRSPGGGHGNPLQYSCLENPMDCSLPDSTVQKSRTWLKQLSTHAHVDKHSSNDANYAWQHSHSKRIPWKSITICFYECVRPWFQELQTILYPKCF